MANELELVRSSPERIEELIGTIRGQKVLLDWDLARIYGVTVRRLNEQARRNLDRFPVRFAFQITAEEFAAIRSHVAGASGRGGRRKLPWAFAEHGVIMLASVLNSPVAVEASIRVVEAFVYLREQFAASQLNLKEITRRLAELEGRVGQHDQALQMVFAALRELLSPQPRPALAASKREIGFHVKDANGSPPVKARKQK